PRSSVIFPRRAPAMGTQPLPGVQQNVPSVGESDAAVLRRNPLLEADQRWVLRRLLPAWLTSGGVHIVLVLLFLLITLVTPGSDRAPERPDIKTAVDTEGAPKANLENDEIGLNPGELLNYNLERIESVSVPGTLNPNELVGIKDAPDGQMLSVSPPPGLGGSV